MAISEKKEALGKGVGKPKKMPPPPEKKDTSGFGGRPYLSGEQFREWLRKPELFSRTGIPERKRLEFEREIRQRYGIVWERSDLQRLKNDLKTGRLKLNTLTTKQALKLLGEFEGKK